MLSSYMTTRGHRDHGVLGELQGEGKEVLGFALHYKHHFGSNEGNKENNL